MQMKLETNRGPLPRRRSPRSSKYPFDTMETGEFFFVPEGQSSTFWVTASRAGSRLGRKFRTRACWMRESIEGWLLCTEADVGATWGVGVWRDE